MPAPNFLSVLADLTDLFADQSNMQFADDRVNEHLAKLFAVLPKDHPVWGPAEHQERLHAWHTRDLRKRDAALANLGLAFHQDGAEVYVHVIDYPRLVEVQRELGCPALMDTLEVDF